MQVSANSAKCDGLQDMYLADAKMDYVRHASPIKIERYFTNNVKQMSK